MSLDAHPESGAGIPSAWLRPQLPFIIYLAVLGILTAWTAHHLYEVFVNASIGRGSQLALIWVFIFGSLIFHVLLSWTNKPWVQSPAEVRILNKLKVVVIIPAYNEDPTALTRSIESLFLQSRLPNKIHVVDDGSTVDMKVAKYRLYGLSLRHPEVEVEWTRTVNQGKRHAQIVVIEASPDADIYVTMDSDTMLDRDCLKNGLIPFKESDVTSVASVVLAYNNRNLVVRITDSWLIAFQLFVRSALSRLGAVLVNSGGFALYRGPIVRKALPSYRNEMFGKSHVMFSDDSMLTLFSQLKGRTVQQESSVAFTLYPEKVSHHLRQQIRWMRGSTIRSIWRFRYLPFNRWSYWENLMAWVNFFIITMVFIFVVLFLPIVAGKFDWFMIAYSVLICYITAARYLVIGRSDQSLWFQIGTYAMAPIMLAWTVFVLRPMRFYAIATCWKTGWGTRGEVEVSI